MAWSRLISQKLPTPLRFRLLSSSSPRLRSSSESQGSHHHRHPLVLSWHHYHSLTNSQIPWLRHLTLRNCTCKHCTEEKCFMYKDAHCPIYTGTWEQPIRTSVNPHFQISQDRCLELGKSYKNIHAKMKQQGLSWNYTKKKTLYIKWTRTNAPGIRTKSPKQPPHRV